MRRPRMNRDHIAVNQSYEGETIEAKVRRVVNNKEPITDGAPLVYQEAKEGVQPAYDIRTDKWDIATDAMDKVHQETVARRKAKVVKMETKDEVKPEVTEPAKPEGKTEGGATE